MTSRCPACRLGVTVKAVGSVVLPDALERYWRGCRGGNGESAGTKAGVKLTLRPDLVLVLGHGGPTKKWVAPVMALDEVAPTLIVHQALPVRRPAKVPPPRGWRPTTARGPIQIVCYRREADGAATRVVGN